MMHFPKQLVLITKAVNVCSNLGCPDWDMSLRRFLRSLMLLGLECLAFPLGSFA